MTGAGATELESVRVTRILRDDIVLGRRAPGSRLVERDIAAELHVSRLPVREAIRVLVSEGVVVARPRTWAVVRE
ncbi:MAG: GntR family transcriptional regulator, partial [Microbacterium sp.]|nr:GntR family transcriptional regulator [Microbacterium sp.]